MSEKIIVASGPIIIEDGKLLVSKDDKDDFYKVPGGRIEPEDKSFEETCKREVKEEVNADIEILGPLNPMLVRKKISDEEELTVILIHYKAKLLNKHNLKATLPVEEFRWLDIEEIKRGEHNVSPNIHFLISKGDIK